MQARESGEVVLEPASARWPIFGVWRTRKSCCTKDHEFLARRSPKKSCCTKNHEFLARQSPKKRCWTTSRSGHGHGSVPVPTLIRFRCWSRFRSGSWIRFNFIPGLGPVLAPSRFGSGPAPAGLDKRRLPRYMAICINANSSGHRMTIFPGRRGKLSFT